MLVVDPEKRLTMAQIAQHRWLSGAEPPLRADLEEDLRLNNTVIEHMLQLPGLDRAAIAHSLETNSFDHIYAIYHLLLDKLRRRARDFQHTLERPRPPAACRRESLNEPDAGSPFVSMPTIYDEGQPLEKFGEMELDQGEDAVYACSSQR